MNKNVCLIGNPNCGKTTLFNILTGTYQKVGNWSGVTVEKKQGVYKKDKSLTIIDLPGLYSLSAISADEKVVIDYLNEFKPDVIINVLDGTNLERNLYLTCILSSLNIPMILAVNFADELEKNDIKLDVKYLSTLFLSPVILFSALKNKNVDKLMELAKKTLDKPTKIEGNIYQFIGENIDRIIAKKQTRSQRFTLKADKLLMNRYLGIPIFFAVISLVYFLSIRVGGSLGELIENAFISFSKQTENSLNKINAPEWVITLICNAVLSGFGTVMGFLPQILVLFTLLTIIEESGYASRVAFLLDGILKKCGLGGKSFIPLMLSSGCAVTGLMATRTMDNAGEKRATIYLAPFMPCGAKMAVFGWFSFKFFGGEPLVATSMYFLSIIITCLCGQILQRFSAFKGNNQTFLLEIPTLRMPSSKDIFFVLSEKVKDFLVKAGTVIFAVSVVLWVLNNFGFSGYANGEIENSFLFLIGNGIKYIFYPLGFCNWQASISVITGVLAKEAVIETLQYVSSNMGEIFNSSYAIYSFMAFVLLSPPCIASIMTAKRELKSNKLLIYMLLFQFAVAYAVSLFINLFGRLILDRYYLIFLILAGIIILLGFKTSLKNIFYPCASCSGKCAECEKTYNRAKVGE